MGDIEALLRAAREKTAAGAMAADLQRSLLLLDSEIMEANALREKAARRSRRSSGPLRAFRRGPRDAHADQIELVRVDALLGSLKKKMAVDQERSVSIPDCRFC